MSSCSVDVDACAERRLPASLGQCLLCGYGLAGAQAGPCCPRKCRPASLTLQVGWTPACPAWRVCWPWAAWSALLQGWRFIPEPEILSLLWSHSGVFSDSLLWLCVPQPVSVRDCPQSSLPFSKVFPLLTALKAVALGVCLTLAHSRLHVEPPLHPEALSL